eukprot:GHVH01004809.1.p1 GENE.GHVH01004809.1~~GHVH01004809.1.p1  ORF type:complete len:395 (+),score=39.38 GHVH01004809.1:132-1316(+)
MVANVQVRVYDISNGRAKRWGPWILGRSRQVGGIWHTGVLVFGWEYFYGGCGIEKMMPEDVTNELPMSLEDTICLGDTRLSQNDFERWILSVQPFFGPKQYDLISWNCNSFTDFIIRKLIPTSDGIPLYISHIVADVERSARGRAIIRILRSVGSLLDPTNSVGSDCDCENCKHLIDHSSVTKVDMDLIEKTKRRFTPKANVRSSSLLALCSKVPTQDYSRSDDELSNLDFVSPSFVMTPSTLARHLSDDNTSAMVQDGSGPILSRSSSSINAFTRKNDWNEFSQSFSSMQRHPSRSSSGDSRDFNQSLNNQFCTSYFTKSLPYVNESASRVPSDDIRAPMVPKERRNPSLCSDMSVLAPAVPIVPYSTQGTPTVRTLDQRAVICRLPCSLPLS